MRECSSVKEPSLSADDVHTDESVLFNSSLDLSHFTTMVLGARRR